MSTVSKSLLCLLLTLLSCSVGDARPARATATDSLARILSVVIENQQVRFSARHAVEHLRLQIQDQAGEPIYDSGAVTETEFVWPLRDGDGKALKGGLYAWTLTVKEPGDDSPRGEQGNFILDRAGLSDKLWVVSEGGEVTILSGTAGVPNGNDVGQNQKAESQSRSTSLKTTGSGTPDTIAKWTGAQQLGDSVIIESGGRVAIGTPSTALGKLEVFNIDGTGVYGINAGAPGSGVFGISTAQSGSTTGVSGVSYSAPGIGVLGSTTHRTGENRGVVGKSHSSAGVGVDGSAIATEGATIGVRGTSESDAGTGVYGTASHTTGVNYGVMGRSESPNGFAGYFHGNVHVTGTLSKGGGAFKIDHPLDPENKFLSHSFVESPDMMNIYTGIVTLDRSGAAEVALPTWFEALNGDFRYQLTCIGGFAPVYVAEKVNGNRFKIAGGQPGTEVSWQLTGIRKDAYAEKHRIPVEEMKSERERGFYLHPEVFNKPEEKSIEWARDPEGMKRMKHARGAAIKPDN